MSIKPAKTLLLGFTTLVLAAVAARAELFSLSASGIIGGNNTADPTIPRDTPWAFELIYDTAAPDRDFTRTNVPTPEIGIFDNNGDRPALLFFHYRAGAYEVTLDEPGDFSISSRIEIAFQDDAHAISIILSAPDLFPPLAGLPVEFNADFDDFTPSTPTLTSDGLPTDTSISRGNFFSCEAVLLLPNGKVVGSAFEDVATFAIAPVPEPSTCAFAIMGITTLLHRRSRPRV